MKYSKTQYRKLINALYSKINLFLSEKIDRPSRSNCNKFCMTSPFLHFYLSKSQNRCKLVAKFTIFLQENHENCQECHFIHLQYSFQWHKLDECTCHTLAASTNLYTIGVPYCYWTTSRVLHCSDASWAHTQVIFYSAQFNVPPNTLQVISGMGFYGSNDHQVHLTMLQSYTCISLHKIIHI